MSSVMQLKKLKKVEPSVDDEREQGRVILETLLRELADNPETIHVRTLVGERTTIYKVDCEKASIAQIIGSRGKTITSLRTVIAAILGKKKIRAIIEIPYF